MSAADAPGQQPAPARTRVLLLVGIAALVLVADVVTKVLAVARLEGREPIELLGGAVYLVLVRNPGAAFSLATGYTWVLSLVAVAVVVVIVRIARRLRSTGWAVALGLVLGGALGNLVDRIFRSPGPLQGHVVDVVSLFAPDGSVWPVFNLADSSIVSGGVLLVLLALTGRELDGTRVVRQHAAKGGAGGPAVRETAQGTRAGRPWVTRAGSRCRTGSTGCAWTPGSRGCWACRAPRSRRSPRRAASRSTGGRPGKSDRLVAGSVARGRAARAGAAGGHRRAPEVVAGLTILHEDDDVVVVDKPVGVAAHPSPGWTGPTVLGGLAALGVRVATSGAAERQGIVHRLDVGTTGVMVVAKSEHAYTRAQAGVQGAHGRQALPRRRAGPPRPVARHRRRARSTATRSTTRSGPSSPAGGRASPTTTRSRRSGRRRCSTSGWRPGAPTRSACTWPRCAIRASATSPTARTRCWRSGCGWSGSGCTPASWASTTRPTGGGWVHQPVPRGPGPGAGPAARVSTRARLARAGGCVVRSRSSSPGTPGAVARRRRPPPAAGTVRLGPEAGEDVAGYLARLPGDPAARRGPRPGAGAAPAEATPSDALAAVAGATPRDAVFRVPAAAGADRAAVRRPGAGRAGGGRARQRAGPGRAGGGRRRRAAPTGGPGRSRRPRRPRWPPGCRCVLALLVEGDGAALAGGRRAGRGAGGGRGAAGRPSASWRWRRCCPEQTVRAEPLPDDGPVPAGP